MANSPRNVGTSSTHLNNSTKPQKLKISSSYAELVASLVEKDPVENLEAIVKEALPQIIPTWLSRYHHYGEEYKVMRGVKSQDYIITAMMKHYGFKTHFTKDKHKYSPIALLIRLWDYDANGISLKLKLMATPKQFKNLCKQPNELVVQVTFCFDFEKEPRYESLYIPWKGTVLQHLNGPQQDLMCKGDPGPHCFGFFIQPTFIKHPDHNEDMALEYLKRIFK